MVASYGAELRFGKRAAGVARAARGRKDGGRGTDFVLSCCRFRLGPFHGLRVQGHSTLAPQATAKGGASVDGRKRGANLLLWAAAQPYPAATSRTGRAFVDELDSGSLKSGHDPCQTLDHPADRAVACFHSLNRRERYPRCLRQGFLLHPHKCPSRLHLGCSEQCRSPT